MFLRKENLTDAISALLPAYEAYAPTGEGEHGAFRRLERADGAGGYALALIGKTLLPPKDILFPRSESLYKVDMKSGETAPPPAPDKTLLFGIRPCDVRSIENLDAAFLEKGYVDAGYAARREALTIVCLACREIPSPACFCDSMGGSPADAAGADVLLTEADDGSGMICEAKTEKGEAVLALWEKLLEKKEPKKPKTPACTLSVKKPDDLAEKLVRNFDDEQWTRFSEPCMACGCCTYVCPTCYCFDIAFEKEGTAADAFRSWDSCLFPKYSLMAGGHNPRWMKTQRLRNRYLHKLSYFDERYGKTLCVGCGRCIENCSQGLDITRVIEWGGTL